MIKLSVTIHKNEEKIVVRTEGLEAADVLKLIRRLTADQPEVKVKIQDTNLLSSSSDMEDSSKEKNEKPKIINQETIDRVAASLAHAVKMDRKQEETIEMPINEFAPLHNTKKTPEGILLLKTYMKCPHCGKEHKARYSRYMNDWIKCFECSEKVALAPVTPEIMQCEGENIPTIGPDGYYLIAVEPYEDKELKDFNEYIVTK